jgi:tetratricopeptide (TPR) repeat protein
MRRTDARTVHTAAGAAGRLAVLFAAAALCAAALVPPAPLRAQTQEHEAARQMMVVDSVIRATIRGLQVVPPDFQAARTAYNSQAEPLSSKPLPPLDVPHRMRLQRAAVLRNQGQFAAARDSLARVLAELPHHPFVLNEWCRTLLALQDWNGVERLARTERAAQADSVLLARALSEAQERLGRQTEAALTAVEAWAASPLMGNLADLELRKPVPYDLAKVRDALRRALAHDATRGDIAAMLARLDWRADDLPAMLKSLRASSSSGGPGSPRQMFAEELLQTGAPRDSGAAIEILVDLTSDRALPVSLRNDSARRAWTLLVARGATAAGATRLAAALADVPPAQWDADLALNVARSLRQSGHTAEARALLDAAPDGAGAGAMALERALTDLRDGPPERALPALSKLASQSSSAAYHYAEALFFGGQCDSAHTWYLKASSDAAGEKTGAALERAFLIEDATPREALPAFARGCYAVWRGDSRAALTAADSLYRVLPRGSLWAETAMMLSACRAAGGDARAALDPLLAVADSLPGSRLAPLARQRAGDLCRDALHDPARAIEQYEACLTRYPGAWNAPAVRRSLEALRRERQL